MKIIQIATCAYAYHDPETGNWTNDILYALTDTGEIWMLDDHRYRDRGWVRVELPSELKE